MWTLQLWKPLHWIPWNRDYNGCTTRMSQVLLTPEAEQVPLGRPHLVSYPANYLGLAFLCSVIPSIIVGACCNCNTTHYFLHTDADSSVPTTSKLWPLLIIRVMSDQATSRQPGILRRWSYGVEQLAARHSYCFVLNHIQEPIQDSLIHSILLYNVIFEYCMLVVTSWTCYGALQIVVLLLSIYMYLHYDYGIHLQYKVSLANYL